MDVIAKNYSSNIRIVAEGYGEHVRVSISLMSADGGVFVSERKTDIERSKYFEILKYSIY